MDKWTYKMTDLTMPIEPEKTVVCGVRWEEGEYEEDGNGKKTWIRPSRLIFPNTFHEEIAIDVSSISLFCHPLIKMFCRLQPQRH